MQMRIWACLRAMLLKNLATSVKWSVKCEKKKKGYFPYRISMLHKMKLEDYAPCYNYCNWFFKKIGSDVETMTTILFSEVGFHLLSRFVNSQNYHIWSINNPHDFKETSIHPIKVSVWCTISK